MTVTSSNDAGTEEVFVFPASFAQLRLWLLDQLEPGRATYNIPLNFQLEGPLDVNALRSALDYLVERHEVLRTTFEARDGEPQQVVRSAGGFALRVVDLRGSAEPEKAIPGLVEEEGNRPFDLGTGPLLRATLVQLGAEKHVLLLTVHHIAADGWSFGIILREISIAYASFVRGADPSLPELPIQYADFSVWQRDSLTSDAFDAKLAYWTKQLAPPLPTLDIPTDTVRDPDRARTAQRTMVRVSASASDAVRTLAREAEVTPFVVLLAAFQILLRRYTGAEDLIVGTPIAGRTRVETEGLIGFFVNTLVLRTNAAGAPTVRQFVARVRDTVLSAMDNQDVPFERIVEAVQPRRDRARNPLFDALFSLQGGGSASDLALPGVAVTKLAGARDTAKFDIQLILNDTPSGFRGTLEYDSDLFAADTMQRFAARFEQLVASAAANPDESIDGLSLMDDAERSETLARGVGPVVARDATASVVSMVRAQMLATPEAIAVEHGKARVSYRELGERAAAITKWLQANGVSRGDRVAICAERTIDVVSAVLGVLAAGAAYVPIDPAYPSARAAYMLEQSRSRVLLASRAGAQRLPGHAKTLLFEDKPIIASRAGVGSNIAIAPTDLAYVLYTSGSTGVPKGVAMGHGAMVNLMEWQRTTSAAAVGTRTLQFASLSFDVSFQELFSTWTTGGTLVLVDEDTRRDPVELVRLMAARKVERVFLPFIAVENLAQAAANLDAPLALREIITAGEQLRMTPAIRALAKRLDGFELVNQYGPTETHVVTALALRGDPAEWPALPSIGRPIDNVSVHVLDALGEPVPDGLPGELYLGGMALAEGYVDDPTRTAERFVAAPAGAREKRLYRTGDLARIRTDGEIEYLGRADDQVKIRGFRVELGEVERVLSDSPLVTACAVKVSGESAAEKRLVAYYILREGSDNGSAAAELRAWCRDRLPEYMVPSAYVAMDVLPKTPSGKLDRRALPEPDRDDMSSAQSYRAPRSNVEHELVQIWERLLPGKRIGIYDDFFESGGHSLLAVQMLAEVAKVRGYRVPLAWLFEASTVEQLAARMSAELMSVKEPPILALRADSAGPPVAFVHGDVRGGGWYCRRLADLAAPESPFYLMPTIGIDDEVFPWTIESIAAIHVAELRKQQPHGPYRVAGFCIGGTIAFEMARQLVAAGQKVDRLVIVDSTALNVRIRAVRPLVRLVPGADDNERLTRRALVMSRLRRYSTRVAQVSEQPVVKQLSWARTNIARRLRRFATSEGAAQPLAATAGKVALDAQSSELATALRTPIAPGPGAGVLLMHSRAASVYFPSRYAGTIDLIWADDRPGVRRRDSTFGWGRYADDVRLHLIESTHMGLVTNDLPLLAEALKAVLERSDP